MDRDTLKGPDRFTVAVRNTVLWARSNQRTLVFGAAALVVLLLAISITTWNAARRNQQAAEHFRRAYTTFRAEGWRDAASLFDDLSRDYPSTAFGHFALLYRGHSLRADDHADDAIRAYEAFLASGYPRPEYRQQAMVALGQLHEDAGRRDDALSAYEQAAALDGPYRIDAEVALGRLQLEMGRRADAKATYERILASGSGELKALAENRLAGLRDVQ